MEAGAPRCYLGDPAKADAEQGRKLYELWLPPWQKKCKNGLGLVTFLNRGNMLS